jgi:intracellular multiplication protein IcmV
MRVIQGTKRILKPLVDFPTWMGYRTLVDNGKSIVQGIKGLFIPIKPTRTESFEQAIARLGLTEKDINSRERAFFWLALFWGLITLGSLVHTCLLFLHGGLHGGFLALALTFLAAVLCFRYHFWHFQVKQRLLGADFKLWATSLFGVKK